VRGYEDRHRVKPGITGWAQVSGLRGQTSIADRVAADNEYIDGWSLGLELRILALTVVGYLPLLGGLLIIAPLLGHATWHAYKDMIH